MPTYGYECLGCDAQFETVQSIKDDPLTTCAVCGGTLRKRIYPVGIAFKGSGFYVNDYAPKSAEGSSAPKAETETANPAADSKPVDSSKPDTAKPDTAKVEAPKAAAPSEAPKSAAPSEVSKAPAGA